MNKPADSGFERREPPELLANCRDLVDTIDCARPARQTDNQGHLRPETTVRLMVGEAVGRRFQIDRSRFYRIVVKKDARRGELNVLADENSASRSDATLLKIARMPGNVSATSAVRDSPQPPHWATRLSS